MSWWDDDDDILGDEPADRIKGAWRTLLARRRERGEAPPTLEEGLSTFAAVLRDAALETPFRAVVATIGNGELGQDEPRSFDGAGSVQDMGGQEARSLLAAAVERIVAAYTERFDRPPRPSELVKTLDFVATADPSAYFSDVDEDAMLRLEAR